MKSIIIIFFVFFPFASINAQNKEADSLKKMLSIAGTDTGKLNILNQLSWSYAFSLPDSALKYALQGLELAEHKKSMKLKVSFLHTLSQALAGKGNFTQALETSLDAFKISEKFKNDSLTTWSLVSIGSIYFYAEDYANALQYFIKTKEYPIEYKKSELFFSGFIGETFFHLNRFDSALYYIQQSHDLCIKSGIHWEVPYLYLGKLYEKKGLFKEALVFYHAGFGKGVAETDSIKTYLAIANNFKQTNAIDSGIYNATLAYTIALKTSLYRYVLESSSILKDFYELGKKTDSAFKYQEIMLAVKDSLFNREKMNQLQNLTFNEQRRKQEILKEKEDFKNKLKIYGLVAALVSISIIVMILIRNNRYKQRAYTLLQKQKTEIDIQKTKAELTLTELRNTQAQLIQSEKMASLGELTAGIAHEIQNPLNFVNNFSEVNKELLDEMELELNAGNKDAAITIAKDIKENEEKINHHGKRADAIVKGMLQHSRSGSGAKEPTNINALAGEYLRLAYQGLRAKDKSFNVTLNTDFDKTIGTINALPQDIGRVLLNLYNNAFYTVNEKKKEQPGGYEPSVSVSTVKVNDKVEIHVKDNGRGISKKVLDKIFQPFFTTKPTGQGTGLGLSLAYDIIKSHGGELNVNTIEEEGSEFILELPVIQAGEH